MTRKEYAAIVEAVRNEYSRTDHSLAETTLLQRLVPSIGAAVSRAGGLDVNGNRRFTTYGFCSDVGVHREFAERFLGQDPMYPDDTRLAAYKPPTWSDMLGDALPDDAHKR